MYYTGKRFICFRIFYLKAIIIIYIYLLSIIYYYMYTLYCSNKKKNINKSRPHLFQNESTAKQMAFPLSETKVEMVYVDNWWRTLRLTRKRSLIYFVELWNNCRGKSFFLLRNQNNDFPNQKWSNKYMYLQYATCRVMNVYILFISC